MSLARSLQLDSSTQSQLQGHVSTCHVAKAAELNAMVAVYAASFRMTWGEGNQQALLYPAACMIAKCLSHTMEGTSVSTDYRAPCCSGLHAASLLAAAVECNVGALTCGAKPPKKNLQTSLAVQDTHQTGLPIPSSYAKATLKSLLVLFLLHQQVLAVSVCEGHCFSVCKIHSACKEIAALQHLRGAASRCLACAVLCLRHHTDLQ